MKDNEVSQAIPVYRIIQELVNNVIKHADAGSAIVQLSRNNHLIGITVEDDGKGSDAAPHQQTRESDGAIPAAGSGTSKEYATFSLLPARERPFILSFP